MLVDALKSAISLDTVQPAIFQVKTNRQGLGIRMNSPDRIMIRYVVLKIDDQIIVIFPDVFDLTVMR